MDESQKRHFVLLLLLILHNQSLMLQNMESIAAALAMLFLTQLQQQERNRRLLEGIVEVQRQIEETSTTKIWMKPQSNDWWENVLKRKDDKDFYSFMRMDWNTFQWIVEKVRPLIETQDTKLRLAIPVDKKVAISIYVLATNADYKTIASLFGLGRSTVGHIFHKFVEAALLVLVPELIKWPQSVEEFKELEKDFRNLWGFPMTVGAIDGCHVPIHPPKIFATDYYNYKGWYSVSMLVISDAKYRCLYMKAGIPGRANDAGAFRNTNIYSKAEAGTLFPGLVENICGIDVPLHLLGDSAFRLESYMIKPFKNQTVDPKEKNFNTRLSRARRVVENLFGHAKARFPRIASNLNLKFGTEHKVLRVALALNNLCTNKNMQVLEKWKVELNCLEARLNNRIQNGVPTLGAQPQVRLNQTTVSHDAAAIRNALMEHFWNQNH